MSRSDDSFTVTITDHGSGINEKIQQNIFDKFYQDDPSHSSEGNGLGQLYSYAVTMLHLKIALFGSMVEVMR